MSYISARPHTKRRRNLLVVTFFFLDVHLSAYLRTEQIIVLSVVLFWGPTL